MLNTSIFDNCNDSLLKNLKKIESRADRKKIKDNLRKELSARFTVNEDEKERIRLTLDGRKNMSRIKNDLDECIGKVLDKDERRMMIDISMTDKDAEIRMRRS